MQKILCCFLIALFLPLGSAQIPLSELRPFTVGSMTAEIGLGAKIQIQGTPGENDWLEIKALTLQNSENKTVLQIKETLRAQGREFSPAYQIDGENKFAVFRVDALGQLGTNPEFELYIQATVESHSTLGLNADFSLAEPFLENTEFALSTPFIESDAPELAAKTALEFQSNSELGTIREITEWVNENIEYDFNKYYPETYSAKQTYQNRAGVCDEFANLTAAFLRAKKIPVKYVSGISFDGKRFGNHGWVQAYLPGTGWIGVDSTYGEAGYVDAAHFSLGKGKDHSEIKNLLVSVHTYDPESVQIFSQLNEPTVEIKKLELLKPSTTIDVQLPEKLGLLEPFQIQATIENTTDKHLILPVFLSLHPDFSLETKSRIVWLKPNEKQTIAWNAVSPATGNPAYYSNYDAIVQTPGQKIKKTIPVFPNENTAPASNGIQITDISPLFSGNALELLITIFNPHSKPETVWATIRQNEQKKTQELTLEPQSTQQFNIRFPNIKPGTANLEFSGAIDENHSLFIPNPKQNQTSTPVVLPTAPEPVLAPPQNQSFWEQLFLAIQGFLSNLFSAQAQG